MASAKGYKGDALIIKTEEFRYLKVFKVMVSNAKPMDLVSIRCSTGEIVLVPPTSVLRKRSLVRVL